MRCTLFVRTNGLQHGDTRVQCYIPPLPLRELDRSRGRIGQKRRTAALRLGQPYVLSNGIPLTLVSPTSTGSVDCRVFASALDAGGIVKALRVPDGGRLSNSRLKPPKGDVAAEATAAGAGGLVFIRCSSILIRRRCSCFCP